MRIGRQAKHYAIYFRRGYGNGKTAFRIFPHLLHDTRAYVAVEIAVSAHIPVSIARSGKKPSRRTILKIIRNLLVLKTMSYSSDSAAEKEELVPIVRTTDRSSQHLDK